MELLLKDKQWFLSNEGSKYFATLTSVGDRAVFIYSYLKTFAKESFEENNILFKTSFILADSVLSSAVEYNSLPKLLDERHNPFIAFLYNAKKAYSEQQVYCIFLSIIHNITDPFNKGDWIYNDSLFQNDGYLEKLQELGHLFVVPNETFLPELKAFECEEKYNEIQLEIIWAFNKR